MEHHAVAIDPHAREDRAGQRRRRARRRPTRAPSPSSRRRRSRRSCWARCSPRAPASRAPTECEAARRVPSPPTVTTSANRPSTRARAPWTTSASAPSSASALAHLGHRRLVIVVRAQHAADGGILPREQLDDPGVALVLHQLAVRGALQEHEDPRRAPVPLGAGGALRRAPPAGAGRSPSCRRAARRCADPVERLGERHQEDRAVAARARRPRAGARRLAGSTSTEKRILQLGHGRRHRREARTERAHVRRRAVRSRAPPRPRARPPRPGSRPRR